MHIRTLSLESGPRRAVLITLCVAAVLACLLFAKWAFGHAVAVSATEKEVASLGVDLASNDPQAHYELSQMLEKTFLPGDEQRAYAELESAVALSPNHYPFWLAFARAREQAGDQAGAERALRRAVDLAPNYSRVRWALGNALLRQGRQAEAFDEIRSAVAADGSFAQPAAGAAWQIFEGDVARIRAEIGDSPRINAAIAALLANDKRFAEAMEFWRLVDAGPMPDDLKETSRAFYNKLVEGGRYRSAIAVALSAGLFDAAEAAAGAVTNGGFESALAVQNPNAFSWTIADGTFPAVGQNNQRRSGEYSLLVRFGQGGRGFRQISQRIAVEPGQSYELIFFYRSELATSARLRCDVFAALGPPIAGMPLNAKQDWGEARFPFTVPADVEGVEMRIGIENCPDNACTVTGNIWFDDFVLVKR